LFQLFLREEENLAAQELAARQKVSELRSILDSEKSQSSVLRALLEAKESGELRGIFGRLGDLGAIDGNLFNFSVLHIIYVVACSHF
jgi:structural maintenance of chromosome 4